MYTYAWSKYIVHHRFIAAKSSIKHLAHGQIVQEFQSIFISNVKNSSRIVVVNLSVLNEHDLFKTDDTDTKRRAGGSDVGNSCFCIVDIFFHFGTFFKQI